MPRMTLLWKGSIYDCPKKLEILGQPYHIIKGDTVFIYDVY